MKGKTTPPVKTEKAEAPKKVAKKPTEAVKTTPPVKTEKKPGWEISNGIRTVSATKGNLTIVVNNVLKGGLNDRNPNNPIINTRHEIQPIESYLHKEAERNSKGMYDGSPLNKKLSDKWTAKWEEIRQGRRVGTLSEINFRLDQLGIKDRPFTEDHVALLE